MQRDATRVRQRGEGRGQQGVRRRASASCKECHLRRAIVRTLSLKAELSKGAASHTAGHYAGHTAVRTDGYTAGHTPYPCNLSSHSSGQSETQFYEKVQADSLAQIKQAEGEGAEAGRSSYVNMLYMLLKLRQACNHPWLVKGASACKGLPAAGVEVWDHMCGCGGMTQVRSFLYSECGVQSSGGGRDLYRSHFTFHIYVPHLNAGRPSASELAAAKKLSPEARLRLLEQLLHPLSQCPVCSDVPEEPVVGACGHVYCRQVRAHVCC